MWFEARILSDEGLTLEVFGKLDETLFRVFEIAPQTINYPWKNSKQKFAKCYDN